MFNVYIKNNNNCLFKLIIWAIYLDLYYTQIYEIKVLNIVYNILALYNIR